MGTGLVRVSYLRSVGEVGATAWEMPVGSAGAVEVDDTNGSPVPWPGKEGLARCLEDELWPPRVFSIVAAWVGLMRKGGGGGGGGGGGVRVGCL